MSSEANGPPVARAGPDLIVPVGYMVMLDGSESWDHEAMLEELNFEWRFVSVPAGSGSYLENANTLHPFFLIDRVGEFVVELKVTNPKGLSATDQLTVTGFGADPLADAGPARTSFPGRPVVLDGSGSSDPDGGPLAYAWTVLGQPGGSSPQLSDSAAATPTFTADLVGEYSVGLIVANQWGATSSAEISVTLITAEEFALARLASAAELIVAMPDAAFAAQGNRNALLNLVRQAIAAVEAGSIPRAIRHVEQALLRTDGWALRGAPDGAGPDRDWVIEQDHAIQLFQHLDEGLEALLSL